MSRFLPPLLAAILVAAVATPLASADQGRGRSGDHDDARRAVELQQALPLSRIMEIAQQAVPAKSWKSNLIPSTIV